MLLKMCKEYPKCHEPDRSICNACMKEVDEVDDEDRCYTCWYDNVPIQEED